MIPEFERGSDCIRENKQFCVNWVVDNFDRVFLPRLVEHIELTAIAVGIGFVIAFTAALIAYTLRTGSRRRSRSSPRSSTRSPAWPSSSSWSRSPD